MRKRRGDELELSSSLLNSSRTMETEKNQEDQNNVGVPYLDLEKRGLESRDSLLVHGQTQTQTRTQRSKLLRRFAPADRDAENSGRVGRLFELVGEPVGVLLKNGGKGRKEGRDGSASSDARKGRRRGR